MDLRPAHPDPSHGPGEPGERCVPLAGRDLVRVGIGWHRGHFAGRGPVARHLFLDLGDDLASDPSPNTPAWVNHIALHMDSVAEIEQAKARLKSWLNEIWQEKERDITYALDNRKN